MSSSKVKAGEWCSFEEAREIVRIEGVTSAADYTSRGAAWRKKHNLPSAPFKVYGEEFLGWAHFLGKSESWSIVGFAEARKKLLALGIATKKEYESQTAGWFEKERLPVDPETTYSRHWRGWRHFLGKASLNRERTFLPYSKARKLVRERGLTTQDEYIADLKWRLRHRLPGDPPRTYGGVWTGWPNFLARRPPREDLFLDFYAARELVAAQGWTSSAQYNAAREWREGNRLPPRPDTFYKEWLCWPDFLGKEKGYHHDVYERRAERLAKTD